MKTLRRFALGIAAVAFLFPFAAQAAVHLAEPNMSALSSGLVAYYPLDGATTNWKTDTTVDMSGQGNTGTLVKMSTTSSPVAGKIGQALKFNGSNQYVALPSTLSSGLNSFTISFWVKTTDAASNSTYYERPTLFGQQTSGFGSQDFGIVMNGGDLGMWSGLVSGDQSVMTTDVIDNNTWHHVVVTYNGTTVYLYLDGVYTGSSLPSTYSLNSNAFDIGASDTNGTAEYFASGTIDDVRVYKRALSPQEIALLYATGQVQITAQSATQSGLSGSLTASWSFDADTVSGTTVEDQSGNGHNLTLENGASISPGYSGDALTLDGADDQYATGEVGTLPTSVALSMWVKASSVSSEQSILVEQDSETANTGYHFTLVGIYNGAFYAGFWNIGDIASTPIAANTWYHVILTYDGAADTQSLYVNGVLQGTQSGTWSPPSTIYFLPGLAQQGCSFTDASGHCGDSANYFTGQIDDLQAYDQAFSTQDVQALSNNSVVTIDHSNTAPSADINSGLIGYWTFDGPTINWNAKTIADSSTQGDTLTMTGFNAATTTAPVPGKIGQALKFNGSTQYLSHANISAFNFGTGDFSVSFWMKPVSPWGTASTIGLIGQKTSDSYNGWQIYQDSGHPGYLDMRITQQNNFLTGSTIPTGTWTYATFVRKGGSTYWYLNGVLSASGTNSASISDTGSFYIGYAPTWTAYYPGALDDVRIYNRALSAQEVAQLYASGR